MPIQITASVLGHPWDLWGLARLFDGSDSSHTLIKANEPDGLPKIDTNDQAQVTRFRVHGYDVFATIISDELVWDEAKGRVDLRDLAPIAQDILARMNGIGILLDPEYKAAKLLSLTYADGDGTGTLLHTDWTRNKDSTPLGTQQEHLRFARDALSLARTNSAVGLVLDAIALPRTWASMYLIYETIAESVGGVHKLDTMPFVSASHLKNFRNAANNNRSLSEGMRHAKKPQPGPFIPFDIAYRIINGLALRWMQSLTSALPPKAVMILHRDICSDGPIGDI